MFVTVGFEKSLTLSPGAWSLAVTDEGTLYRKKTTLVLNQDQCSAAPPQCPALSLSADVWCQCVEKKGDLLVDLLS